jgi:hypothetical protein
MGLGTRIRIRMKDKFRDNSFERIKMDQVYLKEKNKNRHT